MTEFTPIDDLVPLPPQHFEILLALVSGPRHGYGIVQAIEASSKGRVRLATSTLYGSIRRLIAEGLVEPAGGGQEASGGPPRRYYEITPRGRDVLRAEAVRVSELAARVTSLLVGEGTL